MCWQHRTLLAVLIGAGVATVPLLAGAGAVAPPVGNGIRALDEDHVRFPHMRRALTRLREARKQLEQAEDIFKGHREAALDHVDRAIKQCEEALHEQNEKADDVAVTPSPATREGDEKYPHLRHAMRRLREAREQLDAADPIFKGHREQAIDQTDKAIHQIEQAIKDG